MADRPTPGQWWSRVAYVWVLIVALGLTYFVVRIPVQVSDSLANLFAVQDKPWFVAMTDGMAAGYMRPALWLQIELAFNLSAGHYTALLRSVHAAQIVACSLLFVGALRVRDRAAACVAPLGVALLFGSHTFDGTIREAHPINTYLTIVLACLAAFTLSLGRPARWRDVTAVSLFVLAQFSVETGILVVIVLAIMRWTGAQGVSRRALLVAAGVLVAYIGSRLLFLDTTTPALVERASGFGFSILEPRDLQARFGGFPYPFYAYNVLSQIMTVLFAEPQSGVFGYTSRLLDGSLRPAHVIAVGTALGATLVIVFFVASRWSAWRRREFGHDDRVVLVFFGVLVVNAVVSFPYTKDVIVSPAGAFHALAAAVGVRHVLVALADVRWPITIASTVLLALLSSGAAVRSIAAHYRVRESSFVVRNDWTELRVWAARNGIDLNPPQRAALAERLFTDAINRRTPAPTFTDRDARRFLPFIY